MANELPSGVVESSSEDDASLGGFAYASSIRQVYRVSNRTELDALTTVAEKGEVAYREDIDLQYRFNGLAWTPAVYTIPFISNTNFTYDGTSTATIDWDGRVNVDALITKNADYNHADVPGAFLASAAPPSRDRVIQVVLTGTGTSPARGPYTVGILPDGRVALYNNGQTATGMRNMYLITTWKQSAWSGLTTYPI